MVVKAHAALLTGLLGVVSLSFGQTQPKLSADLQDRDPEETVRVIVQYKQVVRRHNVGAVLSKGGRYHGTLEVVQGAVYSVAAKELSELANDPNVAYISPDRTLNSSATLISDFKLQAVNADIAQNAGWNGTGVGVAIIDTGIQDRPDLHGPSGYRVVYAQNFVQNGSAVDKYGHGTHVAGIVAGNGNQSSGVYMGVAPNANLINLLVLDQTGAGTDSNVIAAIQTAIRLKSQYNIRVINLSLGRPVFESYTIDPLCQAVEAAWKAGIVVVVAAGNEGRNNTATTNGYATITAPGNDPYVITVGGMKTGGTASSADDLIASYSSKGPTLFDHVIKPDLVAPGNQIVSVLGDGTLINAYKSNVTDSAYFMLSGTSMATAVVSGAAALLLQQNPQLTPDQVKARLMKTANKKFPVSSTATDPTTNIVYTSYYDAFTVGAGYLDVWAALNNTDVAAGTALSPIASFNAQNGMVSMSNLVGQNAVWGTGVWGTNAVWGTNVISGTNVVWGTNIIWDTSSMQGCNAIWGTNALWGTYNASSEAPPVGIFGER